MVEKKLLKYLKPFEIKAVENLTLEQGNSFFVNIIKDFKDGNLSLDELSVFASQIFHCLAKNKHKNSDLFSASLSAMELNFEVRSKFGYKNISSHLEDVDNFFDKYKK